MNKLKLLAEQYNEKSYTFFRETLIPADEKWNKGSANKIIDSCFPTSDIGKTVEIISINKNRLFKDLIRNNSNNLRYL